MAGRQLGNREFTVRLVAYCAAWGAAALALGLLL